MKARLVMEYTLTVEELSEAVEDYVRKHQPDIPPEAKARRYVNKKRAAGFPAARIAFELPEEQA